MQCPKMWCIRCRLTTQVRLFSWPNSVPAYRPIRFYSFGSCPRKAVDCGFIGMTTWARLAKSAPALNWRPPEVKRRGLQARNPAEAAHDLTRKLSGTGLLRGRSLGLRLQSPAARAACHLDPNALGRPAGRFQARQQRWQQLPDLGRTRAVAHQQTPLPVLDWAGLDLDPGRDQRPHLTQHGAGLFKLIEQPGQSR